MKDKLSGKKIDLRFKLHAMKEKQKNEFNKSILATNTKKLKNRIEYETDFVTLSRRQKQIDYGKNTIGYINYRQIVPINKRSRAHAKTPDKVLKYSRRNWDSLIKIWRIKLHKYDTLNDTTIDSEKILKDSNTSNETNYENVKVKKEPEYINDTTSIDSFNDLSQQIKDELNESLGITKIKHEILSDDLNDYCDTGGSSQRVDIGKIAVKVELQDEVDVIKSECFIKKYEDMDRTSVSCMTSADEFVNQFL